MWRTHLAALALATCWTCAALAENAYTEVGVLMCVLGEPGQAAAGEMPSAEGTREALCTFTATNGEEETYAGSAQGISISTDRRGTLIWVVRAVSGVAEPGVFPTVSVVENRTAFGNSQLPRPSSRVSQAWKPITPEIGYSPAFAPAGISSGISQVTGLL